jgi:hypothetical protein
VRGRGTASLRITAPTPAQVAACADCQDTGDDRKVLCIRHRWSLLPGW